MSNRVVGALDKHLKKNEDKLWSRIDKIDYGKGLAEKTAGVAGLFAPATYLLWAEGALKGPFYAARSASVQLGKKTGHPLDTSKFSKKLPRRSDGWTD